MTAQELQGIIRAVVEDTRASGVPMPDEAIADAILGALFGDIDQLTIARHEIAVEREVQSVIDATVARGEKPHQQVPAIVDAVLARHPAPADLAPWVVELAAINVEAVAHRLLGLPEPMTSWELESIVRAAIDAVVAPTPVAELAQAIVDRHPTTTVTAVTAAIERVLAPAPDGLARKH
jgi:hypothetical protein